MVASESTEIPAVDRIVSLIRQMAKQPNLSRMWDILSDAEKLHVAECEPRATNCNQPPQPAIKVSNPRRIVVTAAQCWANRRSTTLNSAIVELAYRTHVILSPEYDSLRESLGLVTVMEADDKPRFGEDGWLCYRGKNLYQVRRQSTKSRLELLLTAFQGLGWPPRMASPFCQPNDPRAVHDVVKYLNDRIDTIRFSAEGGGRTVAWHVRESS
jgi:hypothetical protein